MSKMIFLVTTQIERSMTVAEAWEAAGSPGVTLIESHGLRRLQEQSRKLEINLFVSMASLLRQIEETNQVLFTVVEDNLVDTMLDTASDILGDLDLDDTGVAFVLPVDRVVGMRRRKTTGGGASS